MDVTADIVIYADDFVIRCKGRAEEAMVTMRRMMNSFKITMNDEKMHLCRIPQGKFDFLATR